MADTANFEAASIASFYQAINNGHSVRAGLSPAMTKAMDEEYPRMSPEWRDGILAGAGALMEWLSHPSDTKNLGWKYAHYDGRTKTIPAADTTTVLNDIWDTFDDEQKRLFANKKDSWNTADVYMVKSSEETKIKQFIDELKTTFQSNAPDVYIGTINAYLSKILEQKHLIPISLKQKTKNVNVNITPTNLHLGPDGLEVKSGSFVTPLNTKMEIVGGKNGKALDFAGNSLRFEVQFEAGTYAKRYVWETKAGSKSADVTEPRDRPVNVSGKYVTAAARNGSIPGPKMAGLVKKYTGEDLNFNIPLTRKLNNTEITYWKTYLKSLKSTPNVPINIGGPSIDGVSLNDDQFIENMALLDGGSPSGKNFDTKVRAKLRHMRYIKMFMDANSSGKLGELISHAYFLSSKMNLSQSDLSGPFIKIQ